MNTNKTMQTTRALFFVVLSLISAGMPGIVLASQDVQGVIDGATWTKAVSPYIIVGAIEIENLTIEPGVHVQANGNFEFEVTGLLSAVGTDSDPIFFETADGVSSWQGIHINNADHDSRMVYCDVSGATNSGLRVTNTAISMEYSRIHDNKASQGGGLNVVMDAAIGGGELLFDNCVITDNDATGHAGGVRISAQSEVVFRDCIVTENVANYDQTVLNGVGGGFYVSGAGGVTLERCQVSSNTVYALSSGNLGVSKGRGGGIFAAGLLTLKNCLVKANTVSAWETNGGSRDDLYGGETARARGGGVCVSGGTLLAFNSIISSNTVTASANNAYPQGSGTYVETGSAEFRNCTIAKNGQEGLRREGGTVELRNCIVFDNTDPEIYGTVTVSFSDIQGGHAGVGNIDVDPLFESLTNLQILEGSPCIDAGDSTSRFNDECFPPSWGTVRNDMGAHGGPEACGWIGCTGEGAPSSPSRLSAVAGSGLISLSWSANCEEDLNSYSVYRGINQGSSKVLVASLNASDSSYIDTDVSAGNYYYYQVSATDTDSEESDWSGEVVVAYEITDAPATPTGLAASSGGGGTTLTWNANGESDLASYTVFRDVTTLPTTQITTVSAGTESYIDGDIEDGILYYYRIKAVNLAGLESDFSAEVSAIVTVADVAITVVADSMTPNIGDEIDFTITLTNNGPNSAGDVKAKILQTNSLSLYSFSGVTEGSYGNGNWTGVELDSGSTESLTLSTIVEGSRPATITVLLSALDASDPVTSNDTSAITITPQIADLRISKSVGLSSPTVGDTITYLVTITNDGPDAATGIVIADTLPAGRSFVSSTPSAGSYSGGLWTIDEAIGNGGSRTLGVMVAVASSGAQTNRAYIAAADQADPDPNNNIASATTSDSLADLSVAVASSNTTPKEGNEITLTVAIANAGPAKSRDIEIAAAEPIGLDFGSFETTAGSYSGGVWSMDSIASGGSDTLFIVATAEMAGSINITATIASSDLADGTPANNSNSMTLNVAENDAPDIAGTDTTTVTSDTTDVEVEATVTDLSGVTAVTLSYRAGGEAMFHDVDMDEVGGIWAGNIPADAFTTRGLVYYITAEDGDGLEESTSLMSILVDASSSSSTTAQPQGSAESSYRLVSAPLDLNDKTPSTWLEDDLGAYDTRKWRFFMLDPSRTNADPAYVEYPDIDDEDVVVPGRGFLLAVNQEDKKLDTGSGQTLSLIDEFEYDLDMGWNLVGNPFDYDLPLSDARMKSGQSLQMWTYGGNWSEMSGLASLEPFEGYAIFANGAGDALVLNPGYTAQKRSVGAMPASLWEIGIAAEINGVRDESNRIAVAQSGAAEKWDDCDRAEPPVIGNYVSVYFPRPDWGAPTSRFSADVRPEPIGGDRWSFEVTTNQEGDVSLTFAGLDDVPAEYEIWLVDDLLRVRQNLRESPSYDMVASNTEHPRRFNIIVGNRAFVDNEVEESDLIPVRHELAQNLPNPFNPTTTIRFGLPTEERVSLRVYALNGREVVSLLDGKKLDAGYHAVNWNGSNRAGNPVASGVYFYRLESEKSVLTRKMVFVK